MRRPADVRNLSSYCRLPLLRGSERHLSRFRSGAPTHGPAHTPLSFRTKQPDAFFLPSSCGAVGRVAQPCRVRKNLGGPSLRGLQGWGWLSLASSLLPRQVGSRVAYPLRFCFVRVLGVPARCVGSRRESRKIPGARDDSAGQRVAILCFALLAEEISENPCCPGNREGLGSFAPIRMAVGIRKKQRYPHE
jgi:hypothetical protein